MNAFVVLLRAIGPATHKLMSMGQWREAAEQAGYRNVRTYVATGNMLLDGPGTAVSVRTQMEEIVRGFGLDIAVVVRKPGQLSQLLAANPFAEASQTRPSQVAVYFFAAAKPDFGWIDDYDGPEHLHVMGNHLIVDYPGDISAGVKLPGLIERRSGTATARNWNTLRGLVERSKRPAAGDT